MEKTTVGIVGVGTYLPSKKMTAKEISEKTNGVWSEEAIINKLGIVENLFQEKMMALKKWALEPLLIV